MDNCKAMHLKQNEQAPDKFGADSKQMPLEHTSEHDTRTSRITGRKHEIHMGVHGAGLVPANPFASLAQEGYLHAHPEKLGKEKLAEFDKATKGMKLPKRTSRNRSS